jgi:hypothetical protein
MENEATLEEQNAALLEQNEKLAAELATFGDKYNELQAKYDALQLDHNQMIAALPSAVRKNLVKKPAYVYGKDECHPVGLGQVCSNCGWDRTTQMRPKDKAKEPHAIC